MDTATKNYYELGRDAGMHFAYYNIALGLNGNQKQLSATFLNFKNMRALKDAYNNNENYYDDHSPSFSSFFDSAKSLNVTWDKNYSYQDLEIFDVMLAQVQPNFVLHRKGHSDLRLQGSFDIGWKKMNAKQADGSQIQVGNNDAETWEYDANNHSYVSTGMAFRANGAIGLEFNRKKVGGDRLQVQAKLRGGALDGAVNDPTRAPVNRALKENADKVFAADQIAYDTEYTKYQTEKTTYLQANSLPADTSDYAYSLSSKKNPPPKPTYASPNYIKNYENSDYIYGFFSGAVSYSKIINKKQLASALAAGKKAIPYRLGLEFNWNIPLYDGFQKAPAGVTYDFNKNNNTMANLKVQFIF